MATRDELSAPEVCRLSGASYRQLDYWSRCGTLRASVEARGSGSQRRYTWRQAHVARVLVVLSKLGARGDATRTVAATLCAASDVDGCVVITSDGLVQPMLDVTQIADGYLVDLTAARVYVEQRAALVAA